MGDMLVKSRKKGDVVSIKLVSGEEIFGRFVSEGPHVITMAKVMKLVIAPNGSPGFTSVLQTSSQEELIFDKNHCLLIAVTEKQISDDYIGATSTIKKATPTETSIIHP